MSLVIGNTCFHSGEKKKVITIIDNKKTELLACKLCIDQLQSFDALLLEKSK